MTMATDTTLRPGEIKDILLREIEAADLHDVDAEEVGTVLEVRDGIARVYGLARAMAGEMLEITSSETGGTILCTEQRKGFHPRESQGNACASQKMTPGLLA